MSINKSFKGCTSGLTKLPILISVLVLVVGLISFSDQNTDGENVERYFSFTTVSVLAQPALPNTPDFGIPSIDSQSSQTSESVNSQTSSIGENSSSSAFVSQSNNALSSSSRTLNQSMSSSQTSVFGSSSRSISNSRDAIYEVEYNSSSLPPIKDILPEDSVRSGGSDWIVGSVGVILLLAVIWYCQKYIVSKNKLRSHSMYKKNRK